MPMVTLCMDSSGSWAELCLMPRRLSDAAQIADARRSLVLQSTPSSVLYAGSSIVSKRTIVSQIGWVGKSTDSVSNGSWQGRTDPLLLA